MSYTYEHPRPSVTLDSVVLKFSEGNLDVLLIKRGNDPFKGHWALPGGFLDMDETPEAGVKRELKEETGVEVDEVVQVGAFGEPDRDPRGRVISLCFVSLIKEGKGQSIKAASDAADATWFPVQSLPSPLAFDHGHILETTFLFTRNKLKLSLMDQASFLGLSMDDIQDLHSLLKEK